MKEFLYRQNNSGGSWRYPQWTGPTELGGVSTRYLGWGRSGIDDRALVDVWVIAESAEEADTLAQQYAGVYFDGVKKDIDCDCCGDRWERSYE